MLLGEKAAERSDNLKNLLKGGIHSSNFSNEFTSNKSKPSSAVRRPVRSSGLGAFEASGSGSHARLISAKRRRGYPSISENPLSSDAGLRKSAFDSLHRRFMSVAIDEQTEIATQRNKVSALGRRLLPEKHLNI